VANWQANLFTRGRSVNSPKGEKSSGSENPIEGKGKKLMSMKLYVGNLAFETSRDELQTLFAQTGTVESVSLIEDRETGRSRGYGFVEMSTKEEGAAAIEKFNGQELGGRFLKVEAKQGENRAGF
jgi:cold-inducible RNA-binding protein